MVVAAVRVRGMQIQRLVCDETGLHGNWQGGYGWQWGSWYWGWRGCGEGLREEGAVVEAEEEEPLETEGDVTGLEAMYAQVSPKVKLQ